jgi:hypothetical protein
VSEPCDGAALAASDEMPDTVTCSFREAMLSVTLTSSMWLAPMCTPVRRAIANAGADTSMA